MSSASKTLVEIFQPAKRLKTTPSPSPSPSETLTPKSPISSLRISHSGDSDGNTGGDPSQESRSALTPSQKARMEMNKSIARSKRNLRICVERIEKAKVAGSEYVKLEELLVEESWLEALPGELQKPYARSLCKFVECETTGKVPIYPPPHLIFNALHSTPLDRVKVVIIGQDPYHGPGQAMGLSFSVPEGIKIPSSLVNVFKELQKDVGCSIPKHGNLEKWARQHISRFKKTLVEGLAHWRERADCKSAVWPPPFKGKGAIEISIGDCWHPGCSAAQCCSYWYAVFFLKFYGHFALVRDHQANSHAKKGWEPFTDAVIRSISQKRRVVFLLWGNFAQEKSRLIDDSKHYILKAAHPSGLSANRGFFGCRHFSRTNEILEKMGLHPVDWQL